MTRAVGTVESTTFEDREVYRCKAAAVGAGSTSTSVLFPSLSWKTSSESGQTYTAKSEGENGNRSLEFKVYPFYQHLVFLVFLKRLYWVIEDNWCSYRYHKSQHDKDKSEPNLHLWKGWVIRLPLWQRLEKKKHKKERFYIKGHRNAP